MPRKAQRIGMDSTMRSRITVELDTDCVLILEQGLDLLKQHGEEGSVSELVRQAIKRCGHDSVWLLISPLQRGRIQDRLDRAGLSSKPTKPID
jgi:hypothetical protein